MPTAFPDLHPHRVSALPRWALARFNNPLTLGSETQITGAFRWEMDVVMQPMDAEAAALFGAWIQSQQGGAGSFTFDLTKWVPGWSPAPGVKTFKLVSPLPFNAEHAVEFGFAFTAQEDI